MDVTSQKDDIEGHGASISGEILLILLYSIFSPSDLHLE